jgi:hypothetical protein
MTRGKHCLIHHCKHVLWDGCLVWFNNNLTIDNLKTSKQVGRFTSSFRRFQQTCISGWKFIRQQNRLVKKKEQTWNIKHMCYRFIGTSCLKLKSISTKTPKADSFPVCPYASPKTTLSIVKIAPSTCRDQRSGQLLLSWTSRSSRKRRGLYTISSYVTLGH